MKLGKKTYSNRFDTCGVEEGIKVIKDRYNNDACINIYSMKDSLKVNISLFTKILDLSPAALKVFNEICKQLEYNDVNVVIEVSKLSKLLNYDRTTISKAVKELVDSDFIVRIVDTVSNKNKHLWSPKMYGINTALFYKGSNKDLYDRANHIIKQEIANELLVFIDD